MVLMFSYDMACMVFTLFEKFSYLCLRIFQKLPDLPKLLYYLGLQVIILRQMLKVIVNTNYKF